MPQYTKNFLWYDLEATDLGPFSQIIEFAAIRTDLDLNPIETHSFKIKLNRDTVPSPQATITHMIAPKETMEGLPEDVAMQKIHRLFTQPQTQNGGYNTLGFDDELLRFSFHRNLISPYQHQYQQGCARFDIYPLVVLYYLFAPEVLDHWPQKEDRISLKLEDLNAANKLSEGPAHRALSDVETTLALAKKLRSKASMWQWGLDAFQKNIDQARQHNLPTLSDNMPEQRLALMIDGRFGFKNTFQRAAVNLGIHLKYGNQTLWLTLDTINLAQAADDLDACGRLIIRKKWGEAPIMLPLKPRHQKHLSSIRLKRIQHNIDWLQAHPEWLAKASQHFRSKTYPEVPNVDVDTALYQLPFKTSEEEDLCQLYHISKAEQKKQIINKINNAHLALQATRLLWRHNPAQLDDADKTRMTAYWESICAQTPEAAPIDFRGKSKLTPKESLSGCDALLKQDHISTMQKERLQQLKDYLIEHFKCKAPA
jgi:exodeoxyribonuclease I